MSKNHAKVAFAPRAHNHEACISQALEQAEARCSERGLRLTALRRRVLELVWADHKPSKAYDLLAAIRDEPFSTAPATVYRALDFLLDAGVIHRIESLNAYVGCDSAHESARPMFLICRHCSRVAELAGPAVDRAISEAARRAGFSVERETVEVDGTCQACAAE